jgi:uncharacterized protein
MQTTPLPAIAGSSWSMNLTQADRDFLILTTCRIIRRKVEGSKTNLHVTPPNANLARSAGCFVSVHSKNGHALRGCIGRIDTASPLLEAMVPAADQVAGDPRFANNPITAAELPNLTIELTIIGPIRPTPTPLDFEPLTDGLYLTAAGRAGVFLPQVARETGWGREQLLDRLCQEKIGLPPHAWRDPTSKLFVFPTENIGPVDFVLEETPA